MAMKTPSTWRSVVIPVFVFLNRTPITLIGVVGADDVIERGIPQDVDLRVSEKPLLQDLLCAKALAPMHDRYPRRKVGKEQRLLNRTVAAPDHDYLLAAVEEPVAGGAGRDAVALELLFGWKIEPPRLRTCRDDQGVCKVDVTAVAFEPERAPRQVRLGHEVGDHAGADVLGLLLHLLHQPGALDRFREARIIFHVGRDGELAAGLEALDQERLQHCAGSVDRSRVAGRARPDDDDLRMSCFRHAGVASGARE
jgi:hypothetical protein